MEDNQVLQVDDGDLENQLDYFDDFEDQPLEEDKDKDELSMPILAQKLPEEFPIQASKKKPKGEVVQLPCEPCEDVDKVDPDSNSQHQIN